MITGTTWRRQDEIAIELECASDYFNELSTEIDVGPIRQLQGVKREMAKDITDTLLLLKWQL